MCQNRGNLTFNLCFFTGDPTRISDFASKVYFHCSCMPIINVYTYWNVSLCRRSQGCLGGFWEGWSKIPIGVVDKVCSLAAEDPKALADRLQVTRAELLAKPRTDVATTTVRNILEIWLFREGAGATLEVLFTALDEINLFSALKEILEHSVGQLWTCFEAKFNVTSNFSILVLGLFCVSLCEPLEIWNTATLCLCIHLPIFKTTTPPQDIIFLCKRFYK